MKYVYIVIALALIAGGYVLIAPQFQEDVVDTTVVVPEGSHVMPDGTIMSNNEMDAQIQELEAMRDMENMAHEETASSDDMAQVAVDKNARVFEVRGVNFEYDVKEIKVKKGETVVINFQSEDGFHDWVVEGYNEATDKVQPGTPTSVTFVADEAGTFEYFCSVGSHRANGMVGKLIVEEA